MTLASKNVGARVRALQAASVALLPLHAEASLLHGETLDTVADVASWVVLVIAPIVAIGLFWILHILPEKIAKKRHHPQEKAIQALCLMSLVFGGLLWPLALLWATSRPVLHKMAYGTDREEPDAQTPFPSAGEPESTRQEERASLQGQIAQLEQELARLRVQLERGESRSNVEAVRPWHDVQTPVGAAASLPVIERKG